MTNTETGDCSCCGATDVQVHVHEVNFTVLDGRRTRGVAPDYDIDEHRRYFLCPYCLELPEVVGRILVPTGPEPLADQSARMMARMMNVMEARLAAQTDEAVRARPPIRVVSGCELGPRA